MSRRTHEAVTVERIERALLILCHAMQADGAVYAPIYERLEQELETMKRTEATLERARQRLEANRHRLVEIGLKARIIDEQ